MTAGKNTKDKFSKKRRRIAPVSFGHFEETLSAAFEKKVACHARCLPIGSPAESSEFTNPQTNANKKRSAPAGRLPTGGAFLYFWKKLLGERGQERRKCPAEIGRAVPVF